MICEEKERERMGIELNEQMGKINIPQLVGGFCCVSEESALVFYSFLSDRVRVTVWAGASPSLFLSLSLSLASERLAKAITS